MRLPKIEAIRTVSGDYRGQLMFRTEDSDWVEADKDMLPVLQKRIQKNKGQVIFTGQYAAYSKALGKHGAIHFLYFELKK